MTVGLHALHARAAVGLFNIEIALQMSALSCSNLFASLTASLGLPREVCTL